MTSILDVDCYELNTGCFAVYGFEYKPGFVADDAVRALSLSLSASESSADPILSLLHSTSPGSTITRARGR